MALKFQWKMVLGLAAFACAFSVFRYSSADALPTRPQNDAALLETFQAHRDQLDKLRQMVTEDHLGPIINESDIPRIQSEARRNEYQNLLKLSPGLTVGKDYEGSVRFTFSSSGGMAIGPGWAKGIQFIPDGAKLLGVLKDSLDGAQALPADVYLRRIEPQWFLFYQRDE